MSGQTTLLLPSGGSITIAGQDSASNNTATLPATTGTLLNNQSNIETQTKAALNATGSAPIYACRAWVNFNGTGTVAIRASGNVSSITDNGVGTYTVNFTTAMPDANFAVVAQGGGTSGGRVLRIDNPTNMTTTTAGPILCRDTSDAAQDWAYVAVAIFR